MVERADPHLLGGLRRAPRPTSSRYARLAARAVGRRAPRGRRLARASSSQALPAARSGTRTSRSRSRRACRSTSSRGWRGEHVKVVLTGEGADELFLGYNRYRVTAWNERLGRAYGRADAARRCAGVRRDRSAALPRRAPPLRRAGRFLGARRRARGRSSARTSPSSRPRCSATCSRTGPARRRAIPTRARCGRYDDGAGRRRSIG